MPMTALTPRPELDRITALAADVFQIPECLAALLTEDQLWIASGMGDQLRAWPRQAHALHDAIHQGLSAWSSAQGAVPPQEPPPLIAASGHDTAPRFWATAPMQTPDGELMGCLCLIDKHPHPEFDDKAMQRLQQFAVLAQTQITSWREQTDLFARAAQERLQLALESAQMGTWDFDFQTKDRIINHRVAKMLGYGPEAISQTIDSWLDWVHPADRHKIIQATQIYRKGVSDTISIEYRIRHRQGHDIWVHSYGKLVERDHRGRPKRVVGTLRDITDQKRRELLQAKHRQLLDLINRVQASFLVSHDLHEACLALFAPLLEVSECEFGVLGIARLGANSQPYLTAQCATREGLLQSTSPSRHDYLGLNNLLGDVIKSNQPLLLETAVLDAQRTQWPAELPQLSNFMGLPLCFDHDVIGLIGLGNRNLPFDSDLVDLLRPLCSTLSTLIHARHQEEARIEAEQEWLRLATEDTLTGLPNRRHFFDVADACLVQSRRYGGPMTIALLDLDNFKQINDTYGHSAGDEVLKVLADILRQALRDSDTPARIGGEEFAVILTSTSLEDSVIALERIRASLSLTPITIGARTLHATVSIGAVQWREDEHQDIHAMLVQADSALYKAKRRGRNRVEIHAGGEREVFDPPHDTGFGLLGLA